MSQEEQIKSAAEIKQANAEIIGRIKAASDGTMTKESSAGSKMIRRKIKEAGFLRRIIPAEPVSQNDLERLPNTELPVVMDEREPNSPGAQSIPFDDTTETVFYRGEKFVTYFNKITTREYVKNIYELMTYRNDVRKVITDAALKDIPYEEDARFINGVDVICGPANGVGATGQQQHFEFEGPITRENYAQVTSILEDQDLNNGVFLMNRKTFKVFMTWDRNTIGGDLSQDLFLEGSSAMKESRIMGVRHILTMKRDIVPDNVVYLFTEPDYLGVFYVLQDVTMHVKKEKDLIRFEAHTVQGTSIANVAGVAKVTFTTP